MVESNNKNTRTNTRPHNTVEEEDKKNGIKDLESVNLVAIGKEKESVIKEKESASKFVNRLNRNTRLLKTIEKTPAFLKLIN